MKHKAVHRLKGSTSAEIKQNLPQFVSKTIAELPSYTRLFGPADFLSKSFDAKNARFVIISFAFLFSYLLF